MLKKLGILVVVLFGILLFFSQISFVRGAECKTTDSDDPAELQQIIDACNNKLGELSEQRNTLASQIQYMDTQIALTQTEVEKNAAEIKQLENEIKNLSSRITELDLTSDKVTDIVQGKIREMYKRQKTNFIYTFINAYNLPNFLRSIQYLKQSQKNDRVFLLKLQNTKVTYEEQRDLREEKEQELEALVAKLESYKTELAGQQQAKESLLTVTKNDENKYQQLLTDAQRQIASFKAFIQSAGGGGVISADSLGTGYDGNYFSQRDERWAGNTVGDSPETILNVGCLITSVAMVLKHKGISVTPADIAANSSYFFNNTAYMLYPNDLPGGHALVRISTSDLDNQINNGNPVIIGVYHGTYGTHFLVVKKKEGDDYLIFDPYYGPDKKFTEIYSKDVIFQANIVN